MTRMTLRWRVAVALVAVVVPIALGFTFFSYRLRRETLLEGTYDAVLARMESGGRERCEARETFDARPERHEGRRARRLARRAVELVARYDASLVSGDPHAPSLDPSIGKAFASGEVAVLDPTSPRGIPRVALRMPWDEGPCAVVLVPAPRAILAGGFARDLVILLGVLALALVAATFALGPPLRRLDLLSKAVAASEGKGVAALAVPDEARGADEIGVLAQALSRSVASARVQVEELEARDAALRAYVDGTTHDLALPLTVIQGHLASLGASAARHEPIDEKELAGASASANYLGQLSANLAAAARLEGKAPLEKRPVDLVALVERVTERLMPIARHRDVELASAVPDRPVMFSGDELLLERAFANLIHNAIRHRGSAPGHVAVLLTEDPIRITIKSDGGPVDARTLAALRAGEVPADAARTRGRGLGLRIVREVASLHGLSVQFRQSEGDEGLEVTLEALPQA
jgi:signal transduction histidine kinase